MSASDLKEQVKIHSSQFLNEILEVRRHLHANPELSFQEEKTAAYVQQKLKEYGVSYQLGYAEHGILATLKGAKKSDKVIALRGDMDALPIEENNTLEFKSLNHGVMHACGHDIHTACLLGAVKVLNQLKEHWGGTVLFVFQPGEEKIPGGAKLMMEDGLFKDTRPDLIIGQHVYPELPAGQVGFKPGKYMASSDEIYLTVKGKGGHAALPHNTIDTVLMGAQIIVSLQQIVSRFIPTQIPAVLSFGNIVCNSVMNVIPESMELQGTFRIMDEEWRYKVHQKIKDIAQSVAQGMGGSCDVEVRVGFPYLNNHEPSTIKAQEAAKKLLGEAQVHDLDIRMTAEDFAWYAQKYPACFYRLGVGYNDGRKTGGLHTPHFLPNEEAILTGMQTMSWLALNALED